MERKKNMGLSKMSSRPLKRITENKSNKKKKKYNTSSINIRNNIIPEIVGFLKSDSYFYSHFISSSSAPSDFSAPSDDIVSSRGKPILGNNNSVREKLAEYLKTDTYMYAPLEGTPNRNDFPPRGQELQFMRMTSTTVLSNQIAWQTKKVAESYAVDKHRDNHGSKRVPHDASVISPQTPALQEVKKQVARRSSRLSTHSG